MATREVAAEDGVMSMLKVIAEQQQQLIQTLAITLYLTVVDLVHPNGTIISVGSQVTMPVNVTDDLLDLLVEALTRHATSVESEATYNKTVGSMQQPRVRLGVV